MGQEGILLSFVEAMDLIDKEYGLAAVVTRLLRLSHDNFDLFDTGKDCAERNEIRTCHFGDDARQGGLAGPRRSPQDQRAKLILLDAHPERLSSCQKMLLANKILEFFGPHPIGQRGVQGRALLGCRFKMGEEVHACHLRYLGLAIDACRLGLAGTTL